MEGQVAGLELLAGWVIVEVEAKNYPRAMLRARVISEGVRTVYPGIAPGIYSVEEARDMPPPGVKDMGAAEVVTEVDAGAWIAAVHDAIGRAELPGIWKDASAACAAANDTDSYAKIKAAVSERLRSLPEAA